MRACNKNATCQPNFDKWKISAEFHFGKKFKKYFNIIIVNLIALNVQMKPAYLWDAFPASSQAISCYIQDLHLDLLVVVLNEDILVLSVPDTLKNLKLKKHAIDISKSLKEPVIASKVVVDRVADQSKNIGHQLKLNQEKILNLQTQDDWNISCIFGLLLNYPVVYWYETGQDTCLSMLPLNVFVKKVKIESLNKEEYVLYSFSSPCCLNHALQDDIKSWNQNFQNVFQAQKIITSLDFTSQTVTLASVAL